MFLFVLSAHFILCAVLVGLVLIQQGKGADMGAAFGAGSSNSLFGAGGATSLIVRITTGVAVAFMVTSITLINLSGAESGLAANAGFGPRASSPLEGSVMKDLAAPNPAAAPADQAASSVPAAADTNSSATSLPAGAAVPAALPQSGEAPKAEEGSATAASSDAAAK